MTIALVLLALAALAGVVLATIRLRGKPYPPMALALLHGTFAALGLVAVIVAVSGSPLHRGTGGLVILLVAAAGGFVLFTNHLRKAALPIPLVVVHALAALAGFLVLLPLVLR